MISCSAGDPISISTWNLEWFPSVTAGKVAPEVEAQRIQEVARVIEALNRDVLLSARGARLAVAVKKLKYHAVVCSAFREVSGAIGRQQQAILSKVPAKIGWSESWSRVQSVDRNINRF